METYIATTTAFAANVAEAYFNGFFGLLLSILPFAIGILIFYIGYNWAKRALGGR